MNEQEIIETVEFVGLRVAMVAMAAIALFDLKNAIVMLW